MDRRITENKGAGSRFDGFVLSIEEGKALGGLRNVEATEILRRSKSASGEEQEKTLVEYAKERGCLFSLEGIKKHFKYLDKGGESEVYLDKGGKYVLKITSYFMSDTPLQFLTNRITLHNRRKKYMNIWKKEVSKSLKTLAVMFQIFIELPTWLQIML